jgi:hypothetical protein
MNDLQLLGVSQATRSLAKRRLRLDKGRAGDG